MDPNDFFDFAQFVLTVIVVVLLGCMVSGVLMGITSAIH